MLVKEIDSFELEIDAAGFKTNCTFLFLSLSLFLPLPLSFTLLSPKLNMTGLLASKIPLTIASCSVTSFLGCAFGSFADCTFGSFADCTFGSIFSAVLGQ